MENECFQEYKSLVSEITKGMVQVKQLRASSSGDQETLLGRMLASYEEALSILTGSAPQEQRQPVISSASDPLDPPVSASKVTQPETSRKDAKIRRPQWMKQLSVRCHTGARTRIKQQSVQFTTGYAPRIAYSWGKYGHEDVQPPVSAYKVTQSEVSSSNPSERTLEWTTQVSEKSDNLYEEPDDGYSWGKYGHEDVQPPVSAYKATRPEVSSSNPRKRTPEWTTQVSVKSDNLYEELDDGFSWRKYGQKDILGSKYPRGYYRCTHRHVRGCLATKMVQRLDDDSSIVEITYRGKHTCEPLVPQVASSEKLE